MSEINEKADRLARGGAVTIVGSTEVELTAHVVGDTGTYVVTVTPGESTCDCDANVLGHRICSHIRAAELYERWGPIWDAERRARQREERRDHGND